MIFRKVNNDNCLDYCNTLTMPCELIRIKSKLILLIKNIKWGILTKYMLTMFMSPKREQDEQTKTPCNKQGATIY
jgi:hypothetical protein